MDVIIFCFFIIVLGGILLWAACRFMDKDYRKIGGILLCFTFFIMMPGCFYTCATVYKDENKVYDKSIIKIETLRDKDTLHGEFCLFLGTGGGEGEVKTKIVYYIKVYDEVVKEDVLQRYERDFDHDIFIIEKDSKTFQSPYMLKVDYHYEKYLYGIYFTGEAEGENTKRYFYVPEGTIKREYKLEK